MSALSPFFLWLIPLALLPVVIHLLNRLRYRTVRWAAMMFLRSADRDASRRAKIRQWLILAARCLMLLMVLLALARLQSKGRLARFLDPGTELVVLLFDRSASMELQRGGLSARERAFPLLNSALMELGTHSRVLWIDPATGQSIPLPRNVELENLPFTEATSTAVDLRIWLRQALAEVVRSGTGQAEIWVVTDRQSSAWLPKGASPPDWSEWEAWSDRVTLRILDTAGGVPDPGNRTLGLVSGPERRGEMLRVGLELIRDTADPESVPLSIETGGLSIREDILVEGERFQWTREIPLSPENVFTHARFEVPVDSHPLDNEVVVAWRDPGVLRAGVRVSSPATSSIFRAAVLPRPGVRELVKDEQPGTGMHVWITDREMPEVGPASDWVSDGGVWVKVPRETALGNPTEDSGWGVDRWEESQGVMATHSREPLRLDLVEVRSAVELEVKEEDQVLAWMTNGQPLLIRRPFGSGAVYRWATLPDSGYSNLDDGYVLVPVVQRMLSEAADSGGNSGTRVAGKLAGLEPEQWESLDGEYRKVGLDVGRYRSGDRILALNRPAEEDVRETLSIQEMEAWAGPLTLRVFEDQTEGGGDQAARTEYTGGLALLGLIFLAVESWLLTRNIRRTPGVQSGWKRVSA